MLTLKHTAYASKLAYLDNEKNPYKILHKSNHKIVSFKGDLSIILDHNTEDFHFCDKKVKIQSALLRYFGDIESDLTENIGSDRQNLIFCGYGAGGAIAVLAAIYYAELYANRNKIACYTFGAPKIGDQNFITWCKEKINIMSHVVTSNDPIPKFPIATDFADFERVIIESPYHDIDTYLYHT